MLTLMGSLDYSGDPNKRAVLNKRAEWKIIVKLINVQSRINVQSGNPKMVP